MKGSSNNVEAWRQHVERLVSEADRAWGPATSPWGAFDYFAALLIRDRVESELQQPELIDEQTLLVVHETDDELRSLTDIDDNEYIRRFVRDYMGDPDPVDRGWWWQRVPARGPVRDELLEILGNRE